MHRRARRSLKAIGRAGVGVDNVDVAAATKRGIVVANAPQSNVVTAAEHTMALLLALARNVPAGARRLDRRALGALASTRASSCMDKTLGILGFGRIGQLVAQRAQGFGMRVIAFDPFVGAERYRELGVEKAESSDEVYAEADFLTAAPAQDARDRGLARRRGAGQVQGRRARPQRRARAADRRRGPRRPRSTRGKVGGAALDVFRTEPITEHPLFGYPNVIVTPHLGASTAEATDRAGFQAAEQVVAALTGGAVTTRGQRPRRRRRGPRGARAVPAALRASLGRLAMALGRGLERRPRRGRAASGASPSATRARSRSRSLLGVLTGHTEEEVNAVNAPSIAEERGIELDRDAAHPGARLHRPRARDRRGAASSACASSARRSAAATARTCSRPGASASTSSSRTTSRCSATATCRA